jgi:hypothetical protein
MRPVIQEVREVITPYRQVVQEIRPVVEEVHTVVHLSICMIEFFIKSNTITINYSLSIAFIQIKMKS